MYNQLDMQYVCSIFQWINVQMNIYATHFYTLRYSFIYIKMSKNIFYKSICENATYNKLWLT